MFGKKITKNNYFKKKLSSTDRNDNIIYKYHGDNLKYINRNLIRSDGTYNNANKTNIYISNNGLTDNKGKLITHINKEKVLFNEDLFIHLNPEASDDKYTLDKSGNNIHGEIIGTSIIKDGLDNVFDFDGTNDTIGMPIIPTYFFLPNGFTFTGWIYSGDLSISNRRIFQFGTNSSNDENAFIVIIKSNRIQVIIKNNTTSIYDKYFTLELNSNIWYHLSIVFDIPNETISYFIDGIYIDNVSAGSTVILHNNVKVYNVFYIGSKNGNNDYYNGQLRDLRFYSRVLTNIEIKQIYQEYLNKKKLLLTVDNVEYQLLDRDLFIYLKFDEDTIIYNNYIQYNTNNDYTGINVSNSQQLNTSIFLNKYRAISFDGTNDRINVTTINGNLFENGFTFSGWVKLTSTSSQYGRIFQFSTDGQNNAISLQFNQFSTAMILFVRNGTGGGVFNLTSTTKTFLNNFLYVSLTVDRQVSGSNIIYTARLYFNSVLDKETIAINSYDIDAVNRGQCYIGFGDTRYIAAEMSELRFYNKVLDVSEINYLYNKFFNKREFKNIKIPNSIFSLTNPTLKQDTLTKTTTPILQNFNTNYKNRLILHLLAKDFTLSSLTTITDYSGNTFQGINNNITTDTDKYIIEYSASNMRSFSFNGTTSYISFETITNNNSIFKGINNGDTWTYTCWIYFNNFSSIQPIFNNGNSNDPMKLCYVYMDINSRLNIKMNSKNMIYEDEFIVDTWYFISIQFNNLDNAFNIYDNIYVYYCKLDNDNSYLGLIENKLYDNNEFNLDNDTSLIIHLSLNNILRDGSVRYTKNISNTTYNGELINMTEINLQNGIFGDKVFEFDGTNDFIELPNLPVSVFEEFTFTGWVKFDTITSTNKTRIFEFGDGSEGSYFYLAKLNDADANGNGNDLIFYFDTDYNEDVSSKFIATNYLLNELNNWIFISISVKVNDIKLYKNGDLFNSSSSYSYSLDDTFLVTNYIGKSSWLENSNFSGQMSDLRFYSRILTASEIFELYDRNNPISINYDNTEFRIGNDIDNNGNKLSGYIDDIRLYKRMLSLDELEYVSNYGKGSYLNGSNMKNNMMVKYLNNDNITLNSRILNQINDESLFDSNNKIIDDSDLFLWIRGDDDGHFDYANKGYSHQSKNTTSASLIDIRKKDYVRCINFDGTDDTIRIPTIPKSLILPNGFTFSAWIKWDTSSVTRLFQFATSNESNNRNAFTAFVESNRIKILIYNNITVIYDKQFTPTLSANTWYHICLVFDMPNNIVNYFVDGLYKDNEPDNTSTTLHTSVTEYSVFYIGSKNGSSNYYDGQMFDIRFYSKLLSDETIRKLYLDKMSNGYEINTAKTDNHSLKIVDYTYSKTATNRLPGVITEPNMYNLNTSHESLSISMWINPYFIQTGTLISNSKFDSLENGDFKLSLEPLYYKDLFLWINPNDNELNSITDSFSYSKLYDGSKNKTSISINGGATVWGTGTRLIFKNELIGFDGTNDFLEVNNYEPIDFRNGFTFCGWFMYRRIGSSQNERIVHIQLDSSSNSIDILNKTDNSRLYFIISVNGEGLRLNINNYLLNDNDRWIFITMTAKKIGNTITMKVYKNKLLLKIDSSAVTGNGFTPNLFYIAKPPDASPYFRGNITDLKFYHRALTQEEIGHIYDRHHFLTLHHYEDNEFKMYQSTIPIELNDWTHTCLNYSKQHKKIEFYQDNNISASFDIDYSSNINTSNLVIGSYKTTSNLYTTTYNGLINDLMIKPDILTSEDIDDIYNLNNKIILDLKTKNIPNTNILPIFYKDLIYDDSFYINKNSQITSQLLINHKIEDLNLSNIEKFINKNNTIYFNGSNDYIKLIGILSNNPLYNINISFWIYIESGNNNSGNHVIFTKRYSSTYSIELKITSENLLSCIGDTVHNTIVNSNTNIDLDTWSFVSVNFINNNGVFLYIDGELNTYTSTKEEWEMYKYNLDGDIRYNTSNVHLGASDGSSNYFEGYIKDFKITNGILSTNNIRRRYDKSRNNINIKTYNNLISYKFDGNLLNYPDDNILTNNILNLDVNTLTSNVSENDNSLLSNLIIDSSPLKNLIHLNNSQYIINKLPKSNTPRGNSLYLDNTLDTNNACIFTNQPLVYNSNISVSLWFKYDSSTEGQIQYLYRFGNTDEGYGVFLNNNELQLSNASIESSNISFSPTLTIDANKWNNLIQTSLVINDTYSHNIYLNGKNTSLTSNTFAISSQNSLFSLGTIIDETITKVVDTVPDPDQKTSINYDAQYLHKFTGEIQHVKVFNRVLDDNEINILSMDNSNNNRYNKLSNIKNNNIKEYENESNNVYISKYSVDDNDNLDAVLPIISRDNLVLHYNPDNYDVSSPSTLIDISDTYRSKYLYNNKSFTGVLHDTKTYDATLINMEVKGSGVVNKNALYFNGSNANVSVFNGGNLYVNSSDKVEWSVSLWIFPENNFLVDEFGIWSKYSSNGIGLLINNDNLNLRINGTNTNTGYRVEYDKWLLLTTTFGIYENKENILSIYINNTKIYNEENDSILDIGITDPFYFGITNNSKYFNGYMDNIMVWDTKLTDGEVDILYNTGINSGAMSHWIPNNIISNNESDNIILNDLGFANNKLLLSNVSITDNKTIINTKSFYFSSASNSHIVSSKMTVIGDNPRSISLWFYLDSQPTTDNEYVIMDMGASGSSAGSLKKRFKISINDDDKIVVDLNGCQVLNNKSLLIGSWYHLVVVVLHKSFHNSTSGGIKYGTDRNIRIFINGVYSVDSSTYTDNILYTYKLPTDRKHCGIHIGSSIEETSIFNGYLDDIRVYKQSLTLDEIINLYNNSRNHNILTL